MVETVEQLKDSHPEIDVSYFANNPSQAKLMQERVLRTYRQFVLNDYKEPLLKVLIALVKKRNKRIGAITKENSVYRLTHKLLDMKERFNRIHDNNSRNELINAGWDILIYEVECNPYYRYILQWLFGEIHDEMLNDNWPPQESDIPPELKPCWKE